MKVLCIVQLPPPVHGAAVMNQHIIEHVLPKSGFDFEVIELDFSKNFTEMHGGNLIKAIKAFRILCKLVIKLIFYRPNLVYFTSTPFGFALIRDLAYVTVCRAFSKKILFHLHGTGLSNTQSSFHSFFYSYIFGNDKLILLSEELFEDVSGYINRERCYIVPNAVESEEKYFLAKNQKDKNVEILYMANYHPAKGLLTVIDVFARIAEDVSNVTLRVVGEYTYYWSEKQMKDYLSKFSDDIRAKIIVHGSAYDSEKREVFKKADIFFYPSSHDAFPLVLLEALSYSLPVVASTQGAISEIIENGESGYLFEANDRDGFEAVLRHLCENFERRNTMSFNAWNRYEKNYSFSIFNKNFIEVLRANGCIH